MIRTPWFLAAAALALLATPAAFGKEKMKKKQHVHDHGRGALSVAAEDKSLALDLDTPAESIFGFEHAARTEAEKKALAEGLATLRTNALELFQLPAALGCKVTEAKVETALERGGTSGEHADVRGEWDFTCDKPVVGATLMLGLMQTFPRLKQLDVQILSGTKQLKKTVKSADEALSL